MTGRALGILLMGVALWDVVVTVLYARARGGIIARTVSYLTWQLFRALAHVFPRRSTRVLPFCGPAVLIMLVGAWALTLTLAAALIMQPALGEGIQASNGPTPTDFITAVYAAGGSLSIVGASDFTPHGSAWRLYFLFNSLVGASVLSLTLTYLMQVYSALLWRNSFALTLHELTNETDDAAELICGLGPRGDFQTGATTLADLSSQMASIRETHHFYPVLFYFRFRESFYSVSHMTLVALDTVTLIKTALDDSTDDGAVERWRKRYLEALRRFRDAGIAVTPNEQAGLAAYVDSRRGWDSVVMALAPAMKYEPAKVDPAGSHATPG